MADPNAQAIANIGRFLIGGLTGQNEDIRKARAAQQAVELGASPSEVFDEASRRNLARAQASPIQLLGAQLGLGDAPLIGGFFEEPEPLPAFTGREERALQAQLDKEKRAEQRDIRKGERRAEQRLTTAKSLKELDQQFEKQEKTERNKRILSTVKGITSAPGANIGEKAANFFANLTEEDLGRFSLEDIDKATKLLTKGTDADALRGLTADVKTRIIARNNPEVAAALKESDRLDRELRSLSRTPAAVKRLEVKKGTAKRSLDLAIRELERLRKQSDAVEADDLFLDEEQEKNLVSNLAAAQNKVDSLMAQMAEIDREIIEAIPEVGAVAPVAEETAPERVEEGEQRIRVRRKSDGRTGSIPVGEFDESKFERI